MDRTAGHPGWVLMRPFVTQSSNCIFPDYVVAALLVAWPNGEGNPGVSACGNAYQGGVDPVTLAVYHASWAGPDDPSNNLVTGQPYYSTQSSFLRPRITPDIPLRSAVSHSRH